MYIESWLIIAIIVVIAYLCYKLTVVSLNIKRVSDYLDTIYKKKQDQVVGLCGIITAANRVGSKHIPKKTKDEVYMAEAKHLITIFKSGYATPFYTNSGERVDFEETPYNQLNTIFLSDIEADDTEAVKKLAAAIKKDAEQ